MNDAPAVPSLDGWSWWQILAPATEDELRAAVKHHSYFEAVHTLLESRGIRVWTGTSGEVDNDPVARVLVVPYPNPASEEYATWGTRREATEDDWSVRPANDYAQHRRDLMAQAMEALLADPAPNSAVRVFTGDHAEIDAHPGARAVRHAIVAAWWDRRRAEGHTLDSARTMLRLLVTPAAWATYDALLDALGMTADSGTREGVGGVCEDGATPEGKDTVMSQNTSTEPTGGPRAGDVVRAKWTMDGATTLAEAADRLDGLAARLRALHAQGWTFAEPVTDDYGFLVDPEGNTGHDDEDDVDNRPL